MIGNGGQLQRCVYIQSHYECDRPIKLGNRPIMPNVNRLLDAFVKDRAPSLFFKAEIAFSIRVS